MAKKIYDDDDLLKRKRPYKRAIEKRNYLQEYLIVYDQVGFKATLKENV